jgi:hypothetical protein
MANELLHSRAQDKALETHFGPRLKLIADRVDAALSAGKQLEL